MTTKSMYIIISVIVLAVLSGALYMHKSTIDHFNIATEPVISNTPYKILENVGTCPARPDVVNPTQYGGLNPKSNANLSLTDFIDVFGKDMDYNTILAADITSRRYCNLLYAANNEYFSDRWSSTSECELEAKAQCQDLFPNAPKKSYFGAFRSF